MESVEELMKRMDLSAAERKGIRIGREDAAAVQIANPKAVGKVFAEKLVNADGLAQALGRIWCPIKGVGCKDMGENQFFFSFHQHSGKRRALEDGPWMFGKDLVLMVDYDETKTIEELEFAYIPIWVRATKMPFGLMNKATGEAIGGELGEFMEMDKEEDDTAVGRFLRIKVRLDIRKPLMRGVTLFVGEEGKEKPLWCPLVYEYLPDFCYTCGLIGHIDKGCARKLKKGEVQQFGKSLRFIPEKKRMEEGSFEHLRGSRAPPTWRPGGSGSRGSYGGSGSKPWSGGSGSDAPSWRKSDDENRKGREGGKRGEEEEVNSPVKLGVTARGGEQSRKVLFLEKEKGAMEDAVDGTKAKEDKEMGSTVSEMGDSYSTRVIAENSVLQAMHVDA
ncbi:unnamed protein product [Urochloa humidicola]